MAYFTHLWTNKCRLNEIERGLEDEPLDLTPAPLAGLGLDHRQRIAGRIGGGGSEELEAFCPSRGSRSRTSASNSATRRSKAAIRASRARQPGQLGTSMPCSVGTRRGFSRP
jgi:hypothetical protein